MGSKKILPSIFTTAVDTKSKKKKKKMMPQKMMPLLPTTGTPMNSVKNKRRRSQLCALSTPVLSLPATPKLTHTEDTLPTHPTPTSTLNTRTFSTTIRDPARLLEERSLDG